MKKITFLLLGSFFCLTAPGQNIVKNNDFTNSEKNPGTEYRTNGGALSLFTEEYTWNRCGKLSFNKLHKSGKYEGLSGAVWIGGSYADNKKPGGFPCKPNTTYDFSIDIRGTVAAANVQGAQWSKGQTLWHGKRLKTTLGSFKVTRDWQTFKGSFTTGPDAVHAALTLSIWENSRYAPLKSKVGDYVLFDNIILKERKRPALNGKPGAAKVEMRLRKIIPADGTVYTDFYRFKGKKPLTAKTAFSVKLEKECIVIDFVCHEPLKVTNAKGNGRKVWSGDVVELFFGPKKNDRSFTQFAVSPNGMTYTSSVGDLKNLKWEIKTRVAPKQWSGTARIPYATLGWKTPVKGEFILFNMARQRAVVRELSTWAKVVDGFGDMERSGKILCGSLPKGVSREAFETAEAKKEADAKQAKMDYFRNEKLLCAPVHVTDNFSVPYLPDALFHPVKGVKLRAALNEIKPLPFAIMNNTAKTAVYRVTVEIPDAKRMNWQNGTPFPGVVYREALMVRDNDLGTSAIYEALPRMNEARTITVAPGECGLVWFDFHTKDLKPGVYNARIRIVPLTGKGVFTTRGYGYGNFNYSGDMKDIPLTFEVSPFALPKDPERPADYFAAGRNADVIRLQAQAGMRIFALSVWSLKFPFKNGKFTPVAPQAEKQIKLLQSMGFNRLWIGYAAPHVFVQHYGKKNLKYFPEWIRTLEVFLKKQGIPLEKSFMEIYDEPSPQKLPEIIAMLKMVRSATPKLRIAMTLGAHIMSAQDMEKLAPYVDNWVLWTSGYFNGREHLDFIKKEQKKGKTFGHYTCATTVRASLAKNFRANPWFGEYHQLNYNNMYQAISNLIHCAWKGHCGDALIYSAPGEKAVPSVRYMAVRQGITDVAYLQKLREVGKNSPEAQAFLKNAAKRVLVDHAHDRHMPDKVREEAAELIVKILQKKK